MQAKRFTVLLLFALSFSASHATLIVHLKNNGDSESDLYFKAIFAHTSPYPFNITATLYVMQTSDLKELKPLDLNGTIVLSYPLNVYQNSTVSLVQQIRNNNGLGVIFRSTELQTLYVTLYSIPVIAITNEDGSIISDLWEYSNRTLTVTIISDDNDLVNIGRSGGSMFLIVANFVILLATLVYVSFQLHSFKAGASVTKIALIGVLLSTLGLIADRCIILLQIYSYIISQSIAAPISIIGPMFIAFSAVFISLYWSTLAFPTTIKMKNRQVFLPILAFCILALIAFAVSLSISGGGGIAFGLQIAFVIIIFVAATYFIVVGAILIRTLNKGNKIVATKRKITKRLTYMLILAGVSMYGIVIVGMFISFYHVSPIATLFATRALLNLFCACSIATLAALFKKPRANYTSSGMNAASSVGDGSNPSFSRFNEVR